MVSPYPGHVQVFDVSYRSRFFLIHFVWDTVHMLPEPPTLLEQVFRHLWNRVISVTQAVR
jgi:hypothetical protein